MEVDMVIGGEIFPQEILVLDRFVCVFVGVCV